jgi:sugar/nucleoside kinase (ribokinase family)
MRTEPRPLDAIVAGDLNADLILREAPPLGWDQEKLARDMELTLGGSSAITAYNLARLGARVGFVGVVGEDWLGRMLAERLEEAGVDLRGLRRVAGWKTGITVWQTRGRRRAGLTYAGTIPRLRAAQVSSEHLRRARHLHVGAYFLLEGLHAGLAALFRRARRLGLTTSLDCNYDPAERWDSGLRKALAATDIFLPNEEEARRISGRRRVEAAAEELGRLARIVVVKRGARGALIWSEGRLRRVPPVRVRAVETTGAGDSFNAGFLAAFLRGAPLEECGRAGAEAGARAVTRSGGIQAFQE